MNVRKFKLNNRLSLNVTTGRTTVRKVKDDGRTRQMLACDNLAAAPWLLNERPILMTSSEQRTAAMLAVVGVNSASLAVTASDVIAEFHRYRKTA